MELTGRSQASVSNLLFGNGIKLGHLENGRLLSTDRYEDAVNKLWRNWPEDRKGDWPEELNHAIKEKQ